MRSTAFLLVLVIVCTGCNCETSITSVDTSSILNAFLGFASSIVDACKGVVHIFFDFWGSLFKNADGFIQNLLNVDFFYPAFSMLTDIRGLLARISTTIEEFAEFFSTAFDKLKDAITNAAIPSFPLTKLETIGDLFKAVVKTFEMATTTSIYIWQEFFESFSPIPNIPEILVDYVKDISVIFYNASTNNFIIFLSTIDDAVSVIVHFFSKIMDIFLQISAKLPFMSNIEDAIKFGFGIIDQINSQLEVIVKQFWSLPIPAAFARLAENFLQLVSDFRSSLVPIVGFFRGIVDTIFGFWRSLFLNLKYFAKSLLVVNIFNPIYTIIIDFIEDVSTSMEQLASFYSNAFEHLLYIITHVTIPSLPLKPIQSLGDLWYSIVRTFIVVGDGLTDISQQFLISFPTIPKIIEIFVNYFKSIFAIFNKTSLNILITFLTSIDDGEYLISRFTNQIEDIFANLQIPKLPFIPYFSLADIVNGIINLVNLVKSLFMNVLHDFWSIPIPASFQNIAEFGIESLLDVTNTFFDALPGLLGGNDFFLSNDIGKLFSSITSKLFPNLGLPVISGGPLEIYTVTTASTTTSTTPLPINVGPWWDPSGSSSSYPMFGNINPNDTTPTLPDWPTYR
ncbi:uncharacterized protein [Diabrotica undecimpunctata]|uniref:uncharacterized protein n=1 Tax=Diabrotica undecimpunctata TaxID=50387 RepID=UPI003B63796B